MRTLPKIEPMVLSLIPEPFDHPDWIFELKHDGFRAIAYLQNGVCQLVSRRRNEYRSFKRLQTELARTLKVDDAILDGEIVCLDQGGRSMFNELLFRRVALLPSQVR
jgi:bifunctional non-homologous end joining protein LigD